MITLIVFGAIGLYLWWNLGAGVNQARDHAKGIRHERGCSDCDWDRTHWDWPPR